MKKLFLFTALAFFGLQISAQDINFKKNNFSSFADWAFYVGESEGEGADIQYGLTHNFTYGLKYMRGLHHAFGVGIGLHYQYQAFHMEQVDTKLVPNITLHDQEIFKLHNLGTEVFMRFTLKRELSKPVVYLEAGGYGNWAYGINHETYNEVEMADIPDGYTELTAIKSDLTYFEALNYGLSAKLGYKMFALIGSYRLSDYFTSDFKEQVTDAEFPRLTIGIQFNPMR